MWLRKQNECKVSLVRLVLGLHQAIPYMWIIICFAGLGPHLVDFICLLHEGCFFLCHLIR